MLVPFGIEVLPSRRFRRERWIIDRRRHDLWRAVLRGVFLDLHSALFVVVPFDDIAHHGSRGYAAVFAAALDDGRYHDFRIAARSVAHKPSVGFLALLAQLSSGA